MNTSHIYIIVSILALAIVALLFFISGKRQKKLTPLTSLAFGFIVAGIVFGDDRLIGYSLLGIGLILSLIDMFRRSRSR